MKLKKVRTGRANTLTMHGSATFYEELHKYSLHDVNT